MSPACCREDPESRNTEIRELHLACVSRIASSSDVIVDSIGARGLPLIMFDDRDRPGLRGLPTRLRFSGVKILSKLSVPAS